MNSRWAGLLAAVVFGACVVLFVVRLSPCIDAIEQARHQRDAHLESIVVEAGQ